MSRSSSAAQDEISFFGLKRDISQYSWDLFRKDLGAGASVALLAIPQAIAYALLAGLPVSCGLLSVIYSTIVAALVGSSRHLVVGPSNATAILLQAGTASVLYTFYRDLTGPDRDAIAVQITLQLTFMVGFLQMLAAFCKLGRLTQFVSHSVIVAYVSGASIAMVVNQLFVFLGISPMLGVHSLFEKLLYLLTNLELVHLPTALVGMGSLLLIWGLHRFNRRIPSAALVFVLAAFAVAFLGWGTPGEAVDEGLGGVQSVLLVQDTGEGYELLPQLSWPFFNWRITSSLLPIAFAIAVLGIMETISVVKSIAASSGQRLSLNQEIMGIGAANLVSSIIMAMPVSGSPSRSGLNYQNGAQTRFSSVFSALIIGILLSGFGFLVARVPLTTLSALLLFTAAVMVNKKQLLLCLKSTKADGLVLIMTLFSCIFFSLDVAFYVGTFLSIILHLRKAAIPQLVQYVMEEDGKLRILATSSEGEGRKIRVIKVVGELFFGAADIFQTTLKAIREGDNATRVIILHLKNARDIDATACLALQQLHDYLKGAGCYLIACGITYPMWQVLSDSGLVRRIGKENLIVFDERNPHQHLEKALLRARESITLMTQTEPPKPDPSLEPVFKLKRSLD